MRRILCENQWNDGRRLEHIDEEENIEGKEQLNEGDILLLAIIIIIIIAYWNAYFTAYWQCC
jgi:hypothetical protein